MNSSIDREAVERHPCPERAIALSESDDISIFERYVVRALRYDLEKIAPTDVSVVITGETGTGKELTARYIHEHSHRRYGPFVAINCGALPENLIDSELFGHERGAFTGAIHSQMGWFEAATGGTLFLDEIGELPLNFQVKLLRVLQEHEVVRVGARTVIPVDVRIIAATNIDLHEAVSTDRFRRDLFFRLNVAMIDLPPLRDLPRDILPLARHFLRAYGRQLHRPNLCLSSRAEQKILSYPWPGNIRELENVIHYATLIASQSTIEPDDLRFLSLAGRDCTRYGLEDDLRHIVDRHFADESPRALMRLTDMMVQTAFEASGRNQVRTANFLGITRNSLRTHLTRLGIIEARR